MKQKALFLILLSSLLVFSACSDIPITGNVVRQYQGTCQEGNIVTKIIKSQEVEMCCFISNHEGREIRSCNSDNLKISEVTIVEQDMITQRKVVYPLGDLICQDIYGRTHEIDNLELIPELSFCS